MGNRKDMVVTMYTVYDIVMTVVLIPVMLIIYFYDYPRDWTKRKYIYGICNRSEYKKDNIKNEINKISNKHNKQAKFILYGSFLIILALIFITDNSAKLVAWSYFVILDILIILIPYALANKELKNLKKVWKITDSKTYYTDLSNAGKIHALNVKKLIIPNVVGIIIILVSFLCDLGFISIANHTFNDDFTLTNMSISLLLTGFMLIPIAIMMDNMRNEVICEDSDINANYNRAKKKNMADMNIVLTWLGIPFTIASVLAIIFTKETIFILISAIVYIVALIIGLALYVKRYLAIEKRYMKEKTLEIDDDDYWIFGMFYCNKNDKRLNVPKRAGIGTTINMAHPVGKVMNVFFILIILASFAMIAWVGVLGKTPIKVTVDNDKLICHQLSDDYTFSIDKIKDVKLEENIKDKKRVRIAGYSMDPVFKGDYKVEGEKCVLFIDTTSKQYITFKYEDKNYIISGPTDKDTEEIYNKIKK